jgi:excisionase family DNA binding protein
MATRKKKVDFKELEWFTLEQAGELLQMDRKTVQRRCEDKTIAAKKYGVKWRIPRSSLYNVAQPG